MCQIVLLGYSRATCARARCRYTLRAPDLERVLVVRSSEAASIPTSDGEKKGRKGWEGLGEVLFVVYQPYWSLMTGGLTHLAMAGRTSFRLERDGWCAG